MAKLKPESALLVAIVFLYVLMALVLTCSCSMYVGAAPCLQYARAVEVRLTECELLPDAWYAEQLRRVYAQCDTGPLGLTLSDAEDVSECLAQVHAASCERMQHGAPTCFKEIRL